MLDKPGNIPTKAEFSAMARVNFLCFVELMFPVLFPGKKLVMVDYIELLAAVFQSVEDGLLRRVNVNLPPRTMKSVLISVLYSAWSMGLNPALRVIAVSYGDDLAHHLSAETRKVIQSKAYKAIFPNTVLQKEAVNQLTTTAGGYRYATAIHSDVTGFGADLIIIDDPMEPADAISDSRKTKIRDWVLSSLLTRFDNSATGRRITVMHRLAPDDLSATLAETADLVVCLPLIAEEAQHITVKTKSGEQTTYNREPGHLLTYPWHDHETVAKLKKETPKHVFESQYQQRPTRTGSGMLSIEKFRRYDPQHLPVFERLIHSWDVGATIGGNASVCVKFGLRTEEGQDLLYILGVVRAKLELPEVSQLIVTLAKIEHPSLVVIDDRGVGLGVRQEVQRRGLTVARGVGKPPKAIELAGDIGLRPSAGKIEKFGRSGLRIADGSVLIPTSAPWLDDFLDEIASFPNSPDKDQVDAMSQTVAAWRQSIAWARMFKPAFT